MKSQSPTVKNAVEMNQFACGLCENRSFVNKSNLYRHLMNEETYHSNENYCRLICSPFVMNLFHVTLHISRKQDGRREGFQNQEKLIYCILWFITKIYNNNLLLPPSPSRCILFCLKHTISFKIGTRIEWNLTQFLLDHEILLVNSRNYVK